MPAPDTAEQVRLADPAWRRWGPWLAERAWGTVREDYSADGDAWRYLPFEEAARTAYRWSEDGLAGVCDAEQYLCLAWAFWNGRDPQLKDRLFGLAGPEGNHGEDAKEQWWYVDATPTGSWLRWRYHYPQQAFPYQQLRQVNGARGRDEPEFELADTGVLQQGFWELEVSYAKAGPDRWVAQLSVTNRGPDTDTLHVLPTLWFRNTWSWPQHPRVPRIATDGGDLVAEHHVLGRYRLSCEGGGRPLLCDNVTDTRGRYGDPAGPPYPKNGIAEHLLRGAGTVNPAGTGTKGALHRALTVPPGQCVRLHLQLGPDGAPPVEVAAVLADRRREADAFHAALLPPATDPARAAVARQAFAGLVWGQCFYHYEVSRWLAGDPAQPAPPDQRRDGRNSGWWHLANREVLSMPDPWEYPWYASWDLAFHTVALAHLDPEFAKAQLLLLTREWYMKPNGQLPAYEWDFGDVNPPVHAWAALEVFRISGAQDYDFLARMFHKLVINHTWWVNREDPDGNNVFEGGFLGLDNIGAFDRSHLPAGAGHLEQADGTAWMAMYCLDLLDMALVLATHDRSYEDVATKFFEHFTYIARSLRGLWDEADGFYYDVLHGPDGSRTPMRVRSVAGLVVLAANRVVPAETLAALPGFAARLGWFVDHHPDLAGCATQAADGSRLLAAVPPDHLTRVLSAVLDEGEFLSPHGLRSLSRRHATHPFVAQLSGVPTPPVDYEPAESRSGLFGGNSNWRGPVWFPLNHLVITGLRRSAAFHGEQVTLPLPTGSGAPAGFARIAAELSERLVSLFLPGPSGRPPAAADGDWPDGLLWFHEYFHGDTGAGLGASHQTGWTALVADLILRPA